MKLRTLITCGFAAMLGIGAFFGIANKSSSSAVLTKADASGATKDYPMIVNCYSDWGGGAFFDNCDVGIYCWGDNLEQATTVKIDKINGYLGAGIVPKNTQHMITVRAHPGSLPCDGFPDGKVYNEFGKWDFDSAKNIITIKKTSGDQEYNGYKAVLLKDRPVMFDTGDYASVRGDWFKDGAIAYAVTGAQGAWYGYSSSEGWNQLTRIQTSGYAYFIPSTTIIAPHVIVTRNHDGSGWGNRWNQTTNMTVNYGFNPLYTTMVESGQTGDNYNWGNKSATETASEFGFYFMDKITCSGAGSITSPSSNWTATKSFYNGLTNDVQGEVWKATGSETGSNIEKGMFRYDYIVFKKHYSGYDDYINRANSSGKAFSASSLPLQIINSSNATSTIVVVTSLISVCALGAFFFLKKKKESDNQ